MGNVLSGKADPGGRLPLTFYRSVDDLPPFADYAMAGRTYRYFAGTPVYPFGYGLSYTTFSYGPLTIEPAAGGAEQGLRVTTVVRNTGQRAGEDVAQLYLDFPDAPGAPNLALRGFRRVPLAPGGAATITFDLSPRDLSSVTFDGVREVLAGAYTVSVGSCQPGEGAPGQSAAFSVGKAVTLPGAAILQVSFTGAQAHTDAGQSSLSSMQITGPGNVILESQQICDFEGHVTWAIGLKAQQRFKVTMLEDPTRVVIDVKQ